jgi:hypothetical protein
MDYHLPLLGLNSNLLIYHSNQAKDLKAFNGWSFSSPSIFDNFKTVSSTTFLYESEYHRIGTDDIELARIRVVP